VPTVPQNRVWSDGVPDQFSRRRSVSSMPSVALNQPQTGGNSTDTSMKDGRHLEHERVGQHYD